MVTSLIKSGTKLILSKLFSEYRINWIYAADAVLPGSDNIIAVPLTSDLESKLTASTTVKMRNSLSYARAGQAGLALVENGSPVCVAHFATPEQYDRNGTWPLQSGEIALMDIATEDAERGRGLAVNLIRAATRLYLGQGQKRMIAFIWWSNTPSSRAFAKAGWKRIGLSLEFEIAGRWRGIRIRR